ncbi:MAG: glycosyltransferase family 2 protein [Chlorobi bacterium]|nr:glycosyltransferase family 2 protein [Chlorobiota bacterium]
MMRFTELPEISVILPTFNRAGLLPKAVESVIAQTWTDWELLVVDDGSSDDTFNVVNPYLERHSAIRYLKHGNRKLNMTRNAGIQAAFGRWVTFLDSDDSYRPEHLESRIGFMQENPEIDMIVGGFHTEGDIFVPDCYNPDRMIDIRECIVGPTLFGRRDVFIALGGFRPLAYAGETELWARAESRFRLRKIEDPKTYIYTRANDSITKTFNPLRP